MDLDKLIKEAYLLKNKEDNINKLYEMVETMLALQESGLLKEVEEEIAVDLGYLDSILNQPPPPSAQAQQAARDFYNLWKDKEDNITFGFMKVKSPFFEERVYQDPERKIQIDSAIQIIRDFLNTADNIDPEILEYMNGFNDTVREKIGYAAAVQKFKDSDGGGVPDSLERDNDTNPNIQNDDLEPYQTQDMAEPEQAVSITQPDIFRDSGAFSKIIETAVGQTVKTPDELIGALTEVAKFSETISEAGQKTQTLFGENGAYNAKNASKLILLDYMNSMISDYSSIVGGYGFEYLLAALAGGQQAGIQTTADGKMGVVDFTFGDGTYGSSKLYGSFAGIKQAVSGFKDKVGQEVFYLIAVRKKVDEKTLGIDLYNFNIKLSAEQPKEINKENIDDIFKKLNSLGAYNKLSKSRGTLKVGYNSYTHYYDFYINELEYPVLVKQRKDGKFPPVDVKFNKKPIERLTKTTNTITFYKTETSSFREQLNQSYEANSVRLIQVLSDIIQNIKNTKKETETYFATGNIDDGFNAFSAVYKTEKGLEEMAGSISGDPEGVKQTKTRAKTENT